MRKDMKPIDFGNNTLPQAVSPAVEPESVVVDTPAASVAAPAASVAAPAASLAAPAASVAAIMIPSIKLAMAKGSWVAVQMAPATLKDRKGIPKRITISLHTNDHALALRRAREVMQKYT